MAHFYLTTPIYYVNAEPHLGHAYTTVVGDAIVRTRRLLGDDVFFLTGTDEHGQKVERAAKAKDMTPQAFTDAISASFKQLFEHLSISNDDFIRTTEPRHIKASQAIWRRVQERGFLYKAQYEGWYCTVDEAFVPETQLVDGRCPDCGGAVDRVSEESYFFKLSHFEKPLLELYERDPEFITPDIRRNEVLSFVKAGLKDLSVSRTSFKWGVPVPDDPRHVMYVWFDALTNYITAAGFPDDTAKFDRFWPADVHLMGKEIVRFHAVYWPAFLMAAGLPLPKTHRRPRLVADERRQDVQVGWQRREAAGVHKGVRSRRFPVFLPAGDVARPRRQLHRLGLSYALQRRPGQRPGKSGESGHDHGASVLRRGRARGECRPQRIRRLRGSFAS